MSNRSSLIISLLCCSSGLPFHDVHPVEVFLIFLLVRYHCRSRDRWLGNHVVQHGPIVLLLVEVRHAWLFDAVRNANVNSVWRQNAVNFVQSLLRIWTAAISAKDWVKSALIDYCVEGTVLKVAHRADVHLLVGKRWVLFPIEFSHLLDHGCWDINVGYVLEAVVEHFFREACRVNSNTYANCQHRRSESRK